ncbi:hypothetical protein WDU94_003370 [Cyamophila willieti]
MKAFWKRKKEGITKAVKVKEKKKRGPKWSAQRRQELADRMLKHWKGITEEERKQICQETSNKMLRYWKRYRREGRTDRNEEFERKRQKKKDYWAKIKAEGNTAIYKGFKEHGKYMKTLWWKQKNMISCRKKTLYEVMQDYWKKVKEGKTSTVHHVHRELSAVMKRYWKKVGAQNVERVRKSGVQSPQRSVHLRAQALRMSETSRRRILKSQVYINKPRTLQEVKDAIRQEINATPEEMFINAMHNLKESLN